MAATTEHLRSRLDRLAEPLLGPVVQSLWQQPCRITSWQWQPLPYIVLLGDRMLAVVTGQALCGETLRTWKVVLKLLGPSASRREAQVYRSGLLERGIGLVPPRLLQCTDEVDGTTWLWLEHVMDAWGGAWGLGQYSQAARHLGQLNGKYLGARALEEAWLNHTWPVMDSSPQAVAEQAWPLLERVSDLPEVAAVLAPADMQRLRRLVQDQPLYLDLLQARPYTLCHHDAAQANLFLRAGPTGSPQTVAIDWEEAGPGSLGADLATLVFSSMRRGAFTADQASALDQQAFAAYLTGLADASPVEVHPSEVRLAYCAAIALRWSLPRALLRLLSEPQARLETERLWQRPATELIAQWQPLTAFLLDRADEARRLATARR